MSENDSLVIIDHYKNLDEKSKIDFRDEVLDRTGMAYSSFYNKISGRSSFSRAELFVIKAIMVEYAEQN